MNEPFVIKNVRQVFNGVLKPGVLSSNPQGRACDALVFFTEGKTAYDFSYATINAETETVIYLPKGSVYRMNIEKRSKYICVDFDFEHSDTPRTAEVYNNLSTSVTNEFMKLFYNRNRLDPWGLPETFSSIYKIYAAALRSKYKSYSQSSAKTAEAIKYMLENYSNPEFSVSDVAQKLGISQMHLRRLIKAKLNTSPIQYITHLRIEKAKNMLQSSNLMISEIAALSGFSDQYYFSREFKSIVGISPTNYKYISTHGE